MDDDDEIVVVWDVRRFFRVAAASCAARVLDGCLLFDALQSFDFSEVGVWKFLLD